MTYATAFPDFLAADWPTVIPEGFVDASWHNDGCPCLWNEATHTKIFIEFSDPAKREVPENEYRYFVVCDDGREFLNDDWAEVLAFVAGGSK